MRKPDWRHIAAERGKGQATGDDVAACGEKDRLAAERGEAGKRLIPSMQQD